MVVKFVGFHSVGCQFAPLRVAELRRADRVPHHLGRLAARIVWSRRLSQSDLFETMIWLIQYGTDMDIGVRIESSMEQLPPNQGR